MMNWEKLLSAKRIGQPSGTTKAIQGRTPFHKDYDRLIFSRAFHRLGNKTQVHSLSTNDHIHNRLTHSLEVSSVGRSLGIRVAQALEDDLPDWIQPYDIGAIVQSACLAHDIGNPPFGHFGEASIRHWFVQAIATGKLSDLSHVEQQDLLHFEGNAQGLRCLTQLEYHQFNGGMRLTYATLSSFIKYPWTVSAATETSKFGCNQTEIAILEDIAEQAGLLSLGKYHWCRHPLAYLMEAADDICYAIIDLEDGVELGMLEESEVLDIVQDMLADKELPTPSRLVDRQYSTRRLTLLRGKIIDHYVNAVANAFINHKESLLAGSLATDLISCCDKITVDSIHLAKQTAQKKIFNTPERTRTEISAYAILEKLLDTFIPLSKAAVNLDRISFKDQKLLSIMGAHRPPKDISSYHACMRAMDFISGMTDSYAVHLAGQLNGDFSI